MTRRGREFLLLQARRAQAAGHDVSIDVRDRRDEFPDQGQAAIKYWAVCTCGYRSRPWARHAMALSAGVHHLGQVADDIELEERRQAADAARQAAAAHHRTTA